MALTGMERKKLARSIVKVCGVRKRVLLRFGFLVTKNNLLLKKWKKLLLGMEEKITGTPRSLECYLASKGKMHITYDY